MTDELPGPDPAWSTDDGTNEWWPALPAPAVAPRGDDGDVNLPQSVPGGMDRLRARVPLLNAHPVPPGVHHDVQHPLDVVVTLRWETGVEETETVALEWTAKLVRVRMTDARVMTGAVWLPAEDVRRR